MKKLNIKKITMTTIANNKGHFFIALTIIVFSCATKKQSDLVGAWEIDEMKITMHSFQNTDSVKVIEVNGNEWEEKMKARNIQTYFDNDGTYHSVHKNLQDSIIYDPAGTWRIENDTLIIQDTIPKRVTYKYKIKVDKFFVEYWGVEDFDQDGKVDDEYYSRQRRIK